MKRMQTGLSGETWQKTPLEYVKDRIGARQIKWAIKLVCLAALAIIALVYIANAGTLRTVWLDKNELAVNNPARRQIAIKKATVTTATVTSIEDYSLKGVKVKFDGVPEDIITGTVWLKEKDVAKINVNDKITVRGNMRYVSITNEVYVGDSWPFPPFSFKAKLLEINNSRSH